MVLNCYALTPFIFIDHMWPGTRSKNHCKVWSKPDVSLLSASREKPAPPLTHSSGLIVSTCARTSRFHRRGSVFFVVVRGGGHFQDRPILPEVHGAWFQRPFIQLSYKIRLCRIRSLFSWQVTYRTSSAKVIVMNLNIFLRFIQQAI